MIYRHLLREREREREMGGGRLIGSLSSLLLKVMRQGRERKEGKEEEKEEGGHKR